MTIEVNGCDHDDAATYYPTNYDNIHNRQSTASVADNRSRKKQYSQPLRRIGITNLST